MDLSRMLDLFFRDKEGSMPLKHWWHLIDLSLVASKNGVYLYELMDNISQVGGVYKCSCGITLT